MITLEKFEEATEAVKKVINRTKLMYSEYFSEITGNKVYLKPENMQYTGAYKVRGAYYKISTLSAQERKKGLITASAGNHAQGVAYAAKLYGAKAVIVMPTTTPLIKVNRTKSYGAEVVLYGDVYDDACTKALELAPGQVVTNRGTVRAEHIIVTTHFPLLNKHGAYFLKLYQHRSYVLALANAPDVKGMYVDEGNTGLSFRNYGSLLLLGGGGHRTGKPGGGWRELEDFAKRHYPQATVAARWAAQDCMTLDGAPYAGRYSRGTEGLYAMTGFNKWGMTSSMAAALLLADLVQGKENPYAELFNPSRRLLRPQLAVNAWESALGLLTPTVPHCPHMGCALKYNPQEHSWDCPCHGSRFGEDGRLLDLPATDGKKL